MNTDLLPTENLYEIAWTLFDVHGKNALYLADKAINDLEIDGYPMAAQAWRGVKVMIEDALLGRIDREKPLIN